MIKLPAKEEIIQNLSNHYCPLSQETMQEFAARSSVHQYAKGEMMVHEGQFAHDLYYVVEGSVRVYYLKDGRDTTDWFAFENEFVSALVSFFGTEASPHYMEAVEDTVVLRIHREQVYGMMDAFRDVERLSNVVLTKTLLQLQHRVVSIQFETAQQRYKNLLAVRPDITQRVPLTHIASYLGITLETLSRVRSLKNKG